MHHNSVFLLKVNRGNATGFTPTHLEGGHYTRNSQD